jgi:DNA-binding PadR family transcriptional regulator
MARSNNSRFVILGFLVDRAKSGYDIRKAIEASMGNFWNESFGQIYPALKELEAEGLVRKAEGPQSSRARRQAYLITPAGRSALEQWVRTPAGPHTYRVETLVKLFFAPLVGPAEARAHIARFKAEHRALLAKYRSIDAHLDQDCAELPGLPYWKLTVDCGLAVGQAYVEWCDRADAVLARLLQGGSHA